MSYIKIKNISKKYKDVSVFSNFSLDIKKGEFISFVGRYGCGKTTLLKLISGVCELDSGEIIVGNEKVDCLKKNSKLGYVFQEPLLIPWKNILSNISMPLELINKEGNEKANELLSIVNMHDKGTCYPHELSGGMQHIVSILRAIVNDPAVLLLDEPLSAVDEINRNMLHEIICKLHKKSKQTTILVTHSIHEAVYLSDKVYILGNCPTEIVGEVVIKHPREEEYKYSSETLAIVDEIRKMLDRSLIKK